MFSLTVRQGKSYSIKVTTKGNLFNFITVKQEGNELIISGNKENYNEKHIPLTVVVSMPSLRAIETKRNE